MKTLRERIQQINNLLTEEVYVDGIIIVPDLEIPEKFENLLIEKKDTFPQIPGTIYTFRKDNPRGIPGPWNLRHIHIYAPDNKELFAINIDGTAHDGCHGAIIPEDIVSFLKKFGFQIPDNRIIEWYPEVRPFSGRILLLD